MNVSSVGVTGFINDRRTDLDFLKSLSNVEELDSSSSKKRCIERIRYRTRSFKPFKVRKISTRSSVASNNKNRRQRRSDVSKSYLWNVKRLFMVRDFNTRIATHSKKFGYKAVERFAKNRSIIHDMSYFKCIIISSTNIIEVLSQFIDNHSNVFSLLGTRNYQRDVGEIVVDFHRRNKFPTQCIGRVLLGYIKSTEADVEENVQRLSLWMHPSIYNDVLQELLVVEEECQKQKNDSSEPFSFTSNTCSHLSRIALRGNKSTDALIKLISENCSSSEVSSSVSSLFLKQLLNYQHMSRLWLPGHILSVDLQLKTKLVSSENNSDSELSSSVRSLKWPSNGNLSPLWSESSATQALNRFSNRKPGKSVRSRWLTRSTESAPRKHQSEDTQDPIIPVVLIRQSIKHVDVRNKASEFSGWDIILPQAALSAVWQLFIHSGVIPVGCDEMHHLQRGVAVLSFPRDYLDTAAGQQYWMTQRGDTGRRNNARPLRNKREHGDILMLLSMLQKGSAEGNEFNTNTDMLSEYPLNKIMMVRGSQYSADFAAPPFDTQQFADGTLPQVTPLPALPPLTLLNVTLRLTGRGLPLDLAQLLRPLPSDYEAWMAGCERRKNRRAKSGDKNESCMWRGVKLRHYAGTKCSYEGRLMLGFITSGQKPHLNSDSLVIGVCAANHLHRLFLDSFGQYPHPQAHSLVLVRNARSQWLRPALVTIL